MKTLRRKTWLFIIFLSVMTASSDSATTKLSLSLKETRIRDFSLSGLTLVFYVKISNSSSSPSALSHYDYIFSVNEKEYIRLQSPLEKEMEIGASGETLLSLPVKITYANLFQAVEGIEKENKVRCVLGGGMTFSEGKKKERIPFVFSGEFPVFKLPEVELASLELKALTIGGSDLSLKWKIKNLNSDGFVVERIRYQFYLEEKLLGEGEIGGDRNIAPGGEEPLSLHFLLDFFDLGKDIYSFLQQTSAICRLAGEAEVRTRWRKVTTSFNKSDKVQIVRTSQFSVDDPGHHPQH